MRMTSCTQYMWSLSELGKQVERKLNVGQRCFLPVRTACVEAVYGILFIVSVVRYRFRKSVSSPKDQS